MGKERAGSFIFFLSGIYGLIFSMGLPMGKWNEPGPGVFPLALSILLCLSGVLWFMHGKGKEKAILDWGGLTRKLVTPVKIIGCTAAFILSWADWGTS